VLVSPIPALRNVIVLLLPSWYRIGEPKWRGETPMNVRVFKNISLENQIIQD
jgi:hypothetical protein